MVDTKGKKKVLIYGGHIARNIIILYCIWAVLVLSFFWLYRLKPINIIDLAPKDTLSSLPKTQPLEFDSKTNEKLQKRLVDIARNKIGIELLAYDVYFYNNAKLAFESSAANPSLAYTDSIVKIISMDKEDIVAYKSATLLALSVPKDQIGYAGKLISIETKESPDQEYAPNATITMSVVGELMVIPQLDQGSRIYIALASFIFALALLNWLKSLTSFLILGPKRYFFEQS